MHTCDGCCYCRRDGSCRREHYPELEAEERRKSEESRRMRRERRKAAFMLFVESVKGLFRFGKNKGEVKA